MKSEMKIYFVNYFDTILFTVGSSFFVQLTDVGSAITISITIFVIFIRYTIAIIVCVVRVRSAIVVIIGIIYWHNLQSESSYFYGYN